MSPRQTIQGPLTIQAPSSQDPALIVRDYDGTEHPLPGPGGGSVPGVERWLPAIPVDATDWEAELDGPGSYSGIPLGTLDLAEGDFILDAMFLPSDADDWADVTNCYIAVGQPATDYESFPPATGMAVSATSAFGDFLQIVRWAGKKGNNGGLLDDPVIVIGSPVLAWLAFDGGSGEPSAGTGTVWIKVATF